VHIDRAAKGGRTPHWRPRGRGRRDGLTVTSTRMQGVGAGVVSLGFAERPRRVSYCPRDALSVLVVAVRRAG
jgi:hypothetical protein